ncbi:MAG: DUF2207 domain-containing protein [Clostridia bacterium]|nr:DUF2207 domain-containing protein [Clostridia bacterium]
MKNGLLKGFLSTFLGINIFLFTYIESFFIIISDFFWAIAGFDVMCVILGVAFVVTLIVFMVYYFKHKDKGDMVKVVEFNSPDEMTPVELGFLVDGMVDSEDVSSLLVYWASKKYIIISNDKDDQKLYNIIEKLPNNASEYEKNIFNAIFAGKKEVLASQIETSVGVSQAVSQAVSTVEKNVGGRYFDAKALWVRQVFVCIFAFLFYFSAMYFRLEYFIDFVPIVEIFAIAATALYVFASDWFLRYYDYRHKNNQKKGKTLALVCLIVLLAVIAGLSCYFFWTDIYQVIFLVCAAAVLFFVCFMSRKIQIYKKDGLVKLGQVLGFKEFLEVAEKDRIKMLVEENPEVFFEVLPYAFVLGVSEKWIGKLEVLEVEAPKLVDKSMMVDVAVCTAFYRSRHIRVRRIISNGSGPHNSRGGRGGGSGPRISFGSNGGAGRSVGGSNFGGIRRR